MRRLCGSFRRGGLDGVMGVNSGKESIFKIGVRSRYGLSRGFSSQVIKLHDTTYPPRPDPIIYNMNLEIDMKQECQMS